MEMYQWSITLFPFSKHTVNVMIIHKIKWHIYRFLFEAEDTISTSRVDI